MKRLFFFQVLVLLVACESKPIDKPRDLFGNVFRIDSIAGQEGLSDPFFIVLTKDSLFSAYGYWGYSFPYETELRINKSLEISRPTGKWTIEPTGEKFWLTMDSVRLLYSIAPGKYDSAYKHLRIMKTQEALLLGQWELQKDKTEANDLLRCQFDNKSLLEFTRTNGNHKIVQLINGVDTCLRRSYRLNGSDILINDDDTFPPYKIIKLDKDILVMQDWKRLLYFKKVN